MDVELTGKKEIIKERSIVTQVDAKPKWQLSLMIHTN